MGSPTRLSKYDAIFYYTDSDRVPMQANVAILLEGPIDYGAYLGWVQDRVRTVPQLTSHLCAAPLYLRLPAWEATQSFRADELISHHVLEGPGDDEQFKALVTQFIHQRIPLSGPLWRLHVVSGLAGGRSALVLRWHHCMADAEGTLEVLKALLETSTPDDASANRVTRAAMARQEGETAPRRRGPTLSLRGRVKQVRTLLAYANLPGPKLPFIKPVSGRLSIAWRILPVGTLREIAAATDATVTDVVLTAMGVAVDRYAEECGVATAGTYLRVQVPANVRLPNKYGELGNELAMLPGVAPLGLADPIERIHRVAAYNRTLKDLHMAALVHGLMGAGFALATPPGQALLCRLMVSRPFLNLAGRFQMPPHEHALLSSIVLPHVNYTVQGHRVSAMLNFIACQFNMGFAVSPVTHEDEMALTVTADAVNFGDAEWLLVHAVKFLEAFDASI